MIKCALVGCGRISAMHLDSIRDIDDLSLSYVCDTDEERAKEAAEKYGGTAVADYKKIPLDAFDIVSITTPNHLHYEMGKYFLEQGKHVLIEKPITLTVAELDELIAIAKKSKLQFFTVKQVRFNPAVRALKTAVAEGKLGKLLSCNLAIHWTRPQAYFESGGWRGKKALDGGTLINQGIHYIDLLVWILGPVESTYAVSATLNHDIEVEDHVSAICRFKNGAVGTIEFNVNTYPHNIDCSIFVQGTKGTVRIDGQAANTLDVWEVEGVPKPAVQEGFSPNVYAGGLYQGSCPNHIFVYENVADVLAGRERKIATSAEDARETLKFIKAIYQSGETGEKVTLS